MSRYDPQRRRRLTTRANTTAVEALLDGEPSRPRAITDGADPGLGPRSERDESRVSRDEPPAARSGCLAALLGMGRR